ncbi:N-acetylglucosaminyldiphosphoundecaprenol N-acetyl-beta-D-mannosaminyltransferase [Paenibacillus sp. UNCCL117]|uniref:WecB/TagA/CpsF family glycosyltransferase n=1 Tax=unclassified Paenibacillus TaxID=185978 RepID=UPI00089161BA|nr:MULTISPECIES: WecB/TagA/CpsF family glycosyltransferase [unclassified Paenibacillus]SDC90754.1 N-acetylglucosaminyldiphosphoundecaprenol N-acetyl-beta-D-mannosaminyltransferase [Paenibacillus sp. cl123]SFW28927.1 N-acetylglucosaminyldiphosphoundecaprenol N-acetyl-beta-D-mannosaminyltransferase [Paenibacillus sp. UNCCL117]
MSKTLHILGVPFSTRTMNETIEELKLAVGERRSKPFHLITANPEIVMKAQDDASLRQIVNDADMITPDGIGIIMASRWKGAPLPERVTGYELLLKLLELGDAKGWSFYFLGADEATNEKAVSTIRSKYPNVRIAGRHNGFFSPEDEQRIVAEVQAAEPDFLIVALGAPGAERWIYKHKPELKAKVAFGVGGSLDVIAGKVKRAPVIWQRLNLEWLYRLLAQPSRWRRQLALPVFAVKAFRDRSK